MKFFGGKLQTGKAYMKVWPQRKELNGLFPENLVIKATEFAEKFMPMLAVLTILLQYQVGHEMFWPTTVGMVLFMVSLPLQGLYWLGKRAQSPLPPSLVRWYHQIHQKLAQQSSEENEPTKQSVSKPTYGDLASVLNQGFKSLDKAFLFD
ncbi:MULTISPECIES: terminus macrodomain insulation protein YfbV [unclassified Motilimonas]|uniref:terminus macrodomain insulation protein YfbV n=1 Tax=Motilimonas TaxID=1914248 RepID=UPI001E490B30|nr:MULTISPECIES: terminus macrodomain insulation protein YfbV [unclassified Motilimonas]MCE0556815.1 DUF412 domain-containing protein [Motilimonas sp. E26]MDO6525135.1 terminus macrodomain insulation protein YfbV [Motilimonas sp. 1_MG-2023]